MHTAQAITTAEDLVRHLTRGVVPDELRSGGGHLQVVRGDVILATVHRGPHPLGTEVTAEVTRGQGAAHLLGRARWKLGVVGETATLLGPDTTRFRHDLAELLLAGGEFLGVGARILHDEIRPTQQQWFVSITAAHGGRLLGTRRNTTRGYWRAGLLEHPDIHGVWLDAHTAVGDTTAPTLRLPGTSGPALDALAALRAALAGP